MINFNVGNFFDKFKSAALEEIRIRQVIINAIEKNTTIKLDIKDVVFSNKIIKVKASPIIKNQIFIKKELIIASVRVDLSNFIVSDIQ